MCITPNFVWIQRGPKWEQSPVACRQCWRCNQNRVNGYVARALAEVSTSQRTCFLTLTYANRDDLAEKVIHPRHFQLFMKMLRRAGHKVRYLVAGEYGDAKGRAHFHVLLFFSDLRPLQFRDSKGKLITRGQTPRYVDDYAPGTLQEDWGPFCDEIPHESMRHIREWPHGHVDTRWNITERNCRYVCKYLLKDADTKHRRWFSLSKKPPIGAEWFAQKAATAKDLQVLPSSFEYMPPGGTTDRKYLMTGATRRDYLNAITKDHRRRDSMSEWVRKSFDKLDRDRIRAALEEAQRLSVISGDIDREEPFSDHDIEQNIMYDPDWIRWWLCQPNPKPDFDYRYPASPWEPPAYLLDRQRIKFREEVKNAKPAHWRYNLDFSEGE